jgi:uncharacterized protein (DUF488 family)
MKRTLTTIGYEGASMQSFLRALQDAGVELLVDIRAVASSRRPGFSKNALAANLQQAGIDYLQLRGLGTPAEGRAAVRAGRVAEMERIYAEHLRTDEAQDQLASLVEIVRGGKRACLLCYEADASHCHRRLVAAAVGEEVDITVEHLAGDPDDE